MKNHKALYYFLIIILLFPMPKYFGDFVVQKLIMVLIVLFFIIAIYNGYIAKKLLPILWVQYLILLLSLVFNLVYINNLYDILSEVLRYTVFFIIVNGILYYLKDIPKNKIVSYSINIMFIVIIIQVSIIILYLSPVYDLTQDWFGVAKVSIGRLRIPGTFENSNYLAFVICCVFSFFIIIKDKIKVNNGILISILLLAIVFFTGSRTGLLTFSILLVIYNPLFFIPLGIVLSGFIINILSSSIRYEFLLDALRFDNLIKIDAFRNRYEIIIDSMDLILENPFFGLMETPIEITDNYFLMYMLRYGILSLVLLLIIIIFYIKRSLDIDRVKFFTLIPFIIVFFIFGMTGSFLDNFRLFFIFALFLILSIKSISERELTQRLT